MTSNRGTCNIPHIMQTMEYGEMLDKANLATAWLSGKKFGPFINGKWIESNSEKGTNATEVHSPDSGEVLTTVTHSSEKDVNTAVQISVDVENPWKKFNGHERNRCLYRISKQLQQNSQLISELAAVSMGIKIRVTRDWDVPLAANVFMYYAGWAQLMETQEKAIGTAAVVTSAACPLSGLAWLIAPVLAVGGTVCLKPSQHHPLLAFVFVDICVKAGLPAGAISVLPGASDVGDSLVRNCLVTHIGYFGSMAVGKNIRQNVSGSSKTLNMLVDSKSTMVVFDSADLNSAVEEAIKASWFYQGQVPWSVRNLLVQESVFTEVVKKLESRMSPLNIGSSLDKAADIGPAVRRNVQEQVMKILNRAQQRGLQIIKPNCANNESRTSFFTPAVVVGAGAEENNVLDNFLCVPVLTVTAFRTAKEAIALANNSLNGLAVSVWTENISLAFDVTKKLEVGIVWVNCHGEFTAGAPFTPRKKSGHGSFCGKEGLLLYKIFPEILPTANEIKMDNLNCGCTTTIANSSRNDVSRAVDVSLNIKNSWEKKSCQLKTEILMKCIDIMHSRADDLKRKNKLSESQLSWCVERLTFWASVCGKQQLTSSVCVGEKHVLSYKEPVGIVAAILSHGDQKLGVDILASSICFGNLVVLASCSLLLYELKTILQAAGVPAGVITVLTGNEVVAPLTEHQAIDAIWYRKEDTERREYFNKVAGWGMKRVWEIPSTVPHEMWEHNSTVSKTVWVPTAEGF
ncbi:putative aldehyde dehydrogenase DhaS [Schistocerca cancellata]|uniref:putative aldehyde dehydrogenase DhaS n=1 Tax=Schistocerca cancellata TaxID=274614 RepID=UPI002117D6E5|nr:putative aldehyde dehydrogenase DhaS [Schistocerca cancellata]